MEGAGKTTQIVLLKAALEKDGYSVCVTREPGGDKIAEGIRSLLLHSEMTPRAELLLFLASRAQNVESVIRPHLEGGGIVLCDRFIDSSVAYQGVARGLGRDETAVLNEFAVGGVAPDLTFLLDLLPETGLARQGEKNRMEAEAIELASQACFASHGSDAAALPAVGHPHHLARSDPFEQNPPPVVPAGVPLCLWLTRSFRIRPGHQ